MNEVDRSMENKPFVVSVTLAFNEGKTMAKVVLSALMALARFSGILV